MSADANSSVPETVDIELLGDVYCVFANGHPIEISDSENGTVITSTENSIKNAINNPVAGINAEGDINIESDKVTFSAEISKKLVIFGGAKEASVTSSSITMTGGEVYALVGGGYFALNDPNNTSKYIIPDNAKPADVSSSNILMTGGSAKSVFGGGMGYTTVGTANITIDDANVLCVAGGGFNGHFTIWEDSKYRNKEYGLNTYKSHGDFKDSFYNITNTANVTIKDGTYMYVLGGGRLGCTYVNETTLKVTGGTFDEIIAGGMNGYTGTANLTVNATEKSIITGLISSGNRGQVSTANVDVVSLGESGKANLIAIGSLTFTSSTDGGPNTIFDEINFNIAEAIPVDNIYLGGAEWYKKTADGKETIITNPWNTSRSNSLASTTITINAPKHTIIAADIGKLTEGVSYENYSDHVKAVDYTIKRQWTIQNAKLQMGTGSDSDVSTLKLSSNGHLCLDNAFVEKDGLDLNVTGNGRISVLNTTFTTKGLSIIGAAQGANKVIIDYCKFNNISDGNNTNAIYLNNCSNICIWNCTIDGVSGDNGTSNYGRGIFVQNCNGSNFELARCQISNVAYNAVQIDASSNFDEILIGFNTFDNWDADNTGSTEESGHYAGGRAIRINLGNGLPLTFISLLENTFTKSYENNSFVADLGTTNSTGYDNGNILKITTTGNNTIADVTLAENKINNSALVMSDENYVIVPASSPGVTFGNVSDDKLYEQNVADLADGISISKVYLYNTLPLSDYVYEVSGTLNYLESYPGFSSLTTMQSGYYLPVKIKLPDNIDAENLSITIVGKETKKVVLDDSDQKTLAKGYLNLVLFVTGEYESFEITVDFDGNGTEYGPSTYLLSLFALEFKGGIKAAPLADQPEGDPVTEIILPGTYEAYISYEGYGDEDIATIKLIAGGVPEHFNGAHTKGYWVGVAIPIPSVISVDTITSAKYYFENTAWNGSTALSPFLANDFMANLYGDGINYVCFYIDANPGSKQYIVIDWDGKSASQPVKYYVDLSDVKILGETCNVSYYDGSIFLGDTTVNCGSVLVKPTDPTKSGYNFAGWYVDKELTIAYDFSKNVYNDLDLYAKWDVKSSGSGGGVPVTPPVTPEEPKEPIIPDSKGNAEIKVDEEKADKLVQETVTSGSKTLELIDKDSIEGTVTSVTVAVEDLKTISDKIENNQNINSVSIATSAGDVIIEKEVLSDILANTDAETIVVEVVDAKDQLNEEQKKVVGDNPVYDINIRAGSEYITNFNGNSITISIPYELQPGEDPNNLVVYYLKDDGTVEKMKGTYKDGKVSFETNHLSKFVIAYEAQEPVTPDNPDKPAKEDNDNTLYYIVAAIIVILIIVALAYYFLKKKQ